MFLTSHRTLADSTRESVAERSLAVLSVFCVVRNKRAYRLVTCTTSSYLLLLSSVPPAAVALHPHLELILVVVLRNLR